MRVLFEVRTQVLSCVREQHLRDERDRGGRAFDVEQDRADPCRRRIAAHPRIGSIGGI